MKRLLFLKLGPHFIPDEMPIKEKYALLSPFFISDIIAVVHDRKLRRFSNDSFHLRGLYLIPFLRFHTLFRNLLYALYSVPLSVYIHYFRYKYDVVITYDPIVTGLLGLLISKLTGAKLIVEVNGNYEKAFIFHSEKAGVVKHIKNAYCRIMIPFILRQASSIKLLNGNQLKAFPVPRPLSTIFIFPNFVPVRHFKPAGRSSPYILFLGYPWHLKGVDLLIKAFNKLCAEFPEYSLKVVGYCPDKTEYIKLAGGNKRIELCDPVWHDEVIELLSGCSLFVLPSRTEAMGRVLVEAMASRKPVIASNVDGIPSLIRHGETGLLFETENEDDLADKIRTMLRDRSYARRLADNAYAFVHTHLSEACYLNNFLSMIEKTVNG
ncbi:MAG: glycosyltransferase family 4 protein [Alphaproteobacteria bacterium]|uniref:Glycosyltransferase family 4 protein n=1 Tax=Candidatus Nitrobium versatile TaxID=2884831 RepID=A0A953LVQ3_9BACT|nr:glycosyltransferase family 4 protein [Candidatus Nitrobium versatile]